MQVRIQGTANLTQAKAEFAALQAQVAGLNAEMAASAKMPVVNPAGYKKLASAVDAGSEAFRNSLASTGAFRVEQMRLNSATQHYTDLLQKQKLTFRDLRKNADIMKAAYKEQLAMQETMVVRQAHTGTGGKGVWDVASAKAYSAELDTLGKRMNWLGAQWKSAGTQMINFGKNTQWAGRQLTVGFTMPMAAVGVAAGVMAYQINKQMTRIKKVYDTTADQSNTTLAGMAAVHKEFAKLESDAWNTASMAASKYGASATDTLGVQAELAATGQKGAKLQAATTEVMKSAMLGEIDYQTATKATIAIQQQLHLSSTQLADSWAYMNSVENSTSLQMKDFASAIPIALGPIKQMGGDLQDLGTLMTAMISRGVAVGKAANAIKALPQRLSRPSKQVAAEFQQLTGQDIVALNKKNPNNIIGLLTDIENATKNLSTLARRKALAGLFGSFQLSNMSAMLQGMDDLQKGIGQTTKAQEIGEQSTQQWAQVSSQEIKQFQQSASGQFKIMVENLKIEVAKMGDPFLKIASTIGNALTKIISAFNDLPSAAKILIAIPLMLAAVAGPALMLVGLFYNLRGNAVRLAGSILSMGKALVIATEEERAMTKAHQQEQEVMASSAGQIKTQTFLLNLLAEANTNAEKATMAFALAQAGVNPDRISAALGREVAVTDSLAKSEMALSEVYALEAKRLEELAVIEEAAILRRGGAATAAQREQLSRTQGGAIGFRDMSAAELQKETEATAKSSTIVATNVKETGKGMKYAGVGAGVFAAGMAASMLTSNKVVQNIAQFAMTGALLGPMFTSLAGVIGVSAGLLGVIGLAVAAIGFGGYKLWQYEKKRQETLDAQNKALGSQKNLMADLLKITPRKRMTSGVPNVADVQGEPGVNDLVDAFKTTKEGKATVGDYKAGENMQKDILATQKYIQILQSVGGNADKAQRYLTAMFIAAGSTAQEATNKAQEYRDKIGEIADSSDKIKLWGDIIDTSFKESRGADTKRDLAVVGKDVADEISRHTLDSANNIMDGVAKTINTRWAEAWTNIDKPTKDKFAKLGVDSAEAFKKAITDVRSKDPQGFLKADFGMNKIDAMSFMTDPAVMSAGGKSGKAMVEAQQAEASIVKYLKETLHLSSDITTLEQVRATWEFKLLGANKANAESLVKQSVAQKVFLNNALMGIGYTSVLSDKQKTAAANQVLAAAHMGQAKTYAEALAIAAGKTADNTGDAANKAGDLKKNLSGLDKLIKISYTFSQTQVQSIRKSGMSGVMDDLANAASTTFDNRMNASLDNSQKMWDKRIAANDAKAQRASTKMDNKWERIHAASDAKWERRKDAMTKFYDKRIDAVDAAIKAEQDAEDIRQKIFEAEKTRLERLSEMANKNIDFNVAVNTGNLDEAAKIRNDIAAQQADWNLSDAADAGSTASQKRVDRMNNSKDALSKQKDAALAQLEKNEKAANASLDRREKKEKAHLEKITKMQATALKNQSDAAMAANKKRWDNDKATFDKQATLFKSYIARNKKDLEGWMKQVGLSYDDFGIKVKGKGEAWSSWFQNSLSSHLRAAGKEIQSDNMWAQMGKQSVPKMLSGMGFKSMAEFKKFIKTGNLPADFGTRDLTPKPAGTPSTHGGSSSGNKGKYTPNAIHSGGEVGKTNNRVGVARSMKGLHSSERLINAQDGEYLVNRRAAAEHRPLLEAINSGKVNPNSRRNIGNGTGGDSGFAPGIGAVAAAGMGKLVAAGLMSSMQKAFSNKIAATGAAGGSYAAGKAGTYGDASFSAEQLKNAAIIASTGSRNGMTARDIEIALITAITEAGLMNLDHGDRDSLGIFQQRSSWGSAASRMNVAQSAQRFFNALKGVPDRNSMSPGQAAQAVQRSAFPDRYQTHWDEAVAIYKTGLTRGKNGGFTAATGGQGGWSRASIPGKGWVNSHDYRNGLKSPLFAYNDGRIVESREIRHGGSGEASGAYPKGFASYGVTVVVQGKDGNKVRYAHMWPGSEAPVGPVKGGALIGRSAATGNATGPHTHFEVNGQEIAREWFQAHGIGLASGGYTTSDGMANLHKDEVVISPNKTNDLYKSLDTFTSFMDSVKNVGSGTGGEPLNATPTSGISRLFSVGLASVGRAAGQAGGTGGSSGGSVIGTGSGPKGTVRSGTLNAHTYGHKPAKTIADLKKVLPTVDSLALQEWTNAAGAAQKWLIKQGWGIFRGPTGTAIAWNKAKYTESHSGSKDLNKGKLPHGISQRYAVYGLLRNKKTGQKFWQASVHLLPNEKYKGYGGKLSHARRQALLGEEYQNVSSLVDRLDNSAPVVLGGDFNNQSLRKIKGLKGFNPGHIDHIYTSGSKGNTSVMSTKGLATDHPYVYGNYALPGLSTGGYTMSDGMAMLHKKELVVDAPTTKMLHDNLQNVASGSNDVYNIHMKFEGDVNNKTELKRFVLNTVAEASARKPQSRRG